MTTFILAYGDERIPYQVKYDDHRSTRVAIHVNPDGTVAVDAPEGYSECSIRQAVQKRARWVVNHVTEARSRFAHVRAKEYISGEQVLYLGRRYVLKVVPVDTAVPMVRLKGNRLEVQSESRSPENIKARMRAWYRVKGRDYLARRIDALTKSLPWTKTSPPFRLLEMSSQWGSCSPAGEIILNPQIIKAPRNCIDYVLIHELAHLKHHDHGPEFWKLIDAYAGDWRKAKLQLDSLVEILLSD